MSTQYWDKIEGIHTKISGFAYNVQQISLIVSLMESGENFRKEIQKIILQSAGKCEHVIYRY